ncbi:TPA: hypothetical protein N0F65_007638 [Lagenidium giganteum]|uniref:Bromo domain-containing protein n=1 Tax=Lagenidium giganteum TaxID=4803 RepID=A0AAV2Z5I9_9STRA|nr:TPA: hypothetical protein N0F65_007638 [Lagenidium giganteum]
MISPAAHAECVRLLDLLINKRVQESWSWVFMTPVTNIPGYDQVIKKPMDLGTVKKNLGSKPSRCRFKSHEKFAKDVRLVFNNALVYNKDDANVAGSVFDAAKHLLRVFETAYAKAKETTFKDEDDQQGSNDDHPPPAAAASTPVTATDAPLSVALPTISSSSGAHDEEKKKSSSKSSSSSHKHKRSREDGDDDDDDDDEERKHKKDKSSKKDKKSKKSKKKKDKDREKKHSSSTSSSSDKKKKKSSSSSHKSSSDRTKAEGVSSSSSKSREPSPTPTPKASSSAAPAIDANGSASTALSATTASPKKASSFKTSTSSSSHSGGASSSGTLAAPKKSSSSKHSSSSSSVPPATTGSIKDSSTPVVKSAVPTPSGSVSSSSASTPTSTSAAGKGMPEDQLTACQGVLMKLIKYKEGNMNLAAPFLQPVDLNHFPDYRIKIPHRMHLYGVQKKLRNSGYADVDAFAYDVRLIFSNCLIYNSDVVLSKIMRSHAVTLLKLFETLFTKIGGTWPGIPDRWKCHQIIHDVLAHRTDGQETAQWFKYPIQTYFDSPEQIPYGYFKKIKAPMDLGTVSARLHLGTYKHEQEFLSDLKLIFDNCIRYWKPDPHGQTYCDSAKMLLNVLKTQTAHVFGAAMAEKLFTKDKDRKSSLSSSSKSKPTNVSSSSAAPSAPAAASTADSDRGKKKSSRSSNFPEKDICAAIVKDLKGHKMKGYRGIEILTAGPFLHAVDTTKYPDYLKIIAEPMDFAKIERKLKSDRYVSVNEFSADVHLIFSNCKKYNSDPVEGADIRAMATSLRDHFVELFNRHFGAGSTTAGSAELDRSSSAVPVPSKPTVKSPTVKSTTSVAIPAAASSEVDVVRKIKKSPSTSPTKRSSSDHASSSRDSIKDTPSMVKAEKPVIREMPQPFSATLGNSSSSDSKASSFIAAHSAPPPPPPSAVPSESLTRPSKSSSVAPVGSAAPALSSEESEEMKKLKREKKEKKERKEKKEKKKDKKKEKKKKKDKKKDREHKEKDKDKDKDKVRKEKDKPAVPSTIAPSPLHSPSKRTSSDASTKKTASSLAPQAKPPLPPPPAPRASTTTMAAVSSGKLAPAESANASRSSKSKKSKTKSDLNSWESACDRVLNRLLKVEHVTKLHFDQPLVELFPQLRTEYLRLILEPMDLRTLREQLHAHTLTIKEFIRKGRLIFQNAMKFNSADDPASLHVREMAAHLQWYFDSLCAEQQHLAESEEDKNRRLQLRKDRADLVNTVAMEMKAKECQKLLRVLNSQKHDKNCWPFRKPVKVLFPSLSADYFEIIKKPMDLTTVAEKLNSFEYKTHGDFFRDVQLTFENAKLYNRADKDREGWSVYAAASHMLGVIEDLWGEVTLEVTEKIRRREVLRKERERVVDRKRKDEKELEKEKERKWLEEHKKKLQQQKVDETLAEEQQLKQQQQREEKEPSPPAAPSEAAATASDAAATKVKLHIVNRPTAERATKSERKAEEKRRKRARKEEEMARSEKRRRTAVAATDDALREAEMRSRRKMQKLEIATAVKLREERERKMKEENAEKALSAKMKFNATTWSGVLAPSTQTSQGFWSKKRIKLEIPSVFQQAIGTC